MPQTGNKRYKHLGRTLEVPVLPRSAKHVTARAGAPYKGGKRSQGLQSQRSRINKTLADLRSDPQCQLEVSDASIEVKNPFRRRARAIFAQMQPAALHVHCNMAIVQCLGVRVQKFQVHGLALSMSLYNQGQAF